MKIIKNIKKYPYISMIALSSVIFGIYYIPHHFVNASVSASIPIQNAPVDEAMSDVHASTAAMEETKQDNDPASVSENIVYEFQKADVDYFNDALFIGDSRSVGLFEYAGWDNATFYVENGLTIWDTLDKELIPLEGTKEKISIRNALQKNTFGKIYIMVGINELGRGTPDSYLEEFKNVVQTIRKLQPNATIYIEAVMHVTIKKDEEGTYINNAGINERNAKLETLADHQSVFYIDVNSALDDENGGLNEAYTFDGVHLKASYIGLWKTFLLENTIQKPD